MRVTVLRFGSLDVGPVVGYSFDRDEDDADRLGGLGDIDGGINIGGFAALRFAPIYIDAAYIQQVTGADDVGHTIRLGAGWENQTYASIDYMDAHFSVSPVQAAASEAGLPAYDADASFKNISLELGADYKVADRWTVTSKLGYSLLLGDAADSPITASKSQFSGGFGLTYTFGRIR